MDDFYAVLGVSPEASSDTIRQAYRQQAKQSHPDLQPGPAAEVRMRQLNAARETLLDPEQRRQYDRQRALAAPARPMNAHDGFDIHEAVTITVAQAAAGATYQRPFHRPDGTPFTLVIAIPPGVAGGTRLRLPGAGVRGVNGGRDGDFILTVWVAEAAGPWS